VKTISAIILVAALGCAKTAPQPQEKEMSETPTFHASDVEPVINTMSLTSAVPIEEMPAFLRERNKRTPPTISIEDVRALEAGERKQVLAVIKRALEHHRADARKYRNRGNPAELIADGLEAFLNAARQ
jgi:hypothetical protein